jgi:putative ABC transport system permease protein
MALTNDHIDQIRTQLRRLGVPDGILSDEYLDHVCCDIEDRMSNGISFQDSMQQVFREIDAKTLRKFQSRATTFRSFRPFDMLKNHFITTIRAFKRSKGYASLNIVGLALGVTSFVFLFQYIRFELSYDRFHENAEDIYRVRVDQYFPGTPPMRFAVAFIPTGPAMVEDIPEVTHYVTMNKLAARGVVTYFPPATDPVAFQENDIFYASPGFFDVFSFQLVESDPQTALSGVNQVVITEITAKKYFGNDDPIGKTLVHNGRGNFKVTGVVKDPPRNSHMRFKMLLSFETLIAGREQLLDNWGWWDFYTYIKVQPGADPQILQRKVDAIIETRLGKRMLEQGYKAEFILQPLTDIHLNSNVGYEHEPNGNIKTVVFLGIIAIFILILSWVNYINLSTSRALERAKEVGIRKTVGSPKALIVQQFLMESFIYNIIAIVLGMAAAWILQPTFSRFLGYDLPLTLDGDFVLIIVALILVGTLLSGTYPAFVLSSAPPLSAMSRAITIARSGAPSLRTGMVVFQMAISIALVAFTLGVQRQVSFMTNHDLGMSIDQTLIIKGPAIRDSTYGTKFNTFKTNVMNHHLVAAVATSSDIPGKEIEWSAGFFIKGTDPNRTTVMRIMGVDSAFMRAYDVRLLAGRGFGGQSAKDTVCIINSAALQALNIENAQDAIGVVLDWGGANYRIVGVADNFRYRGLSNETEPVIMWGTEGWSGYYSIKLNLGDNPSQNIKEIIALAERQWKSSFPESPFDYFFLDDFFNAQYHSEVRFGKVFGLFSGLAIGIACLGLFGLSSYSVSRRTREIGIRKVMGASFGDILLLLGRNYALLLLVASTVAIPLSYFAINRWLDGFPERFAPGTTLFILPVLIVFLLMAMIIGYHTMMSARSNPVDSIKSD